MTGESGTHIGRLSLKDLDNGNHLLTPARRVANPRPLRRTKRFGSFNSVVRSMSPAMKFNTETNTRSAETK